MAEIAKAVSKQGTAVVWGESGAVGVTRNLSLNNLASGSARMGQSADLGELRPPYVIVEARMESGTAPTAGGSIDVYVLWSTDNVNWAAGVTGSDGAWPADGNEDEWTAQLGLPVVQVIATNDLNTTQRQNGVKVPTYARFVTVVVDNNWDQATRNQGTPTDNTSRVVLTPDFDLAIDP